MSAGPYVLRHPDGEYVAKPDIVRAHPRNWPLTRFRNDADIFASREQAIEVKRRMSGFRGLRVERAQP